MNRSEAEKIRAAVEVAVKIVLGENGLKASKVSATYDTTGMNFRIESRLADLKIEETPEGRAFIASAGLYGLEPTDLGRTFHSRGIMYRLMGLQTNRPKYPFDCKRMDNGKTFKFTPEGVKQGLKVKA